MKVSKLWGLHKGEDAYVVGTGPSMRCFPMDFFRNRLTIGLNQAWRYGGMRYCVTVHPELVVEYEKEESGLEEQYRTQWIVKAKKAPLAVDFSHPRYYVFYSHGPTKIGHRLDFFRIASDSLYVGRGIQQTGINLAVHMGCRAVFLVGVDMCSLDGQHHAHRQHTRWLGLPPEDVYREYLDFTDHARTFVRFQLGIPVLTLSPFVGLKHVEEDYGRLKKLLRLDPLPKSDDVSSRRRAHADKPEIH